MAQETKFALDQDPEFLLSRRKKRAFDHCRQHLDDTLYIIEEDGSIYVKLRWELLVQFGTKKQLARFDKLRVVYVNYLLEKHCTPLLQCHTQVVGSRSAKSNVDINMICPKHMEEVLHGIYQEHDKHFPSISLEELFDTNIYGSVFHFLDDRCDAREMTLECYPRYEMGYRQRMWSFLRIVELCERELPKKERVSLVSQLPTEYQNLYTNTKVVFLQQRRRKSDEYVRAISKYMKELARSSPDPHKIAEAFSRSKVVEHDTYRSIGAVLHIVEHRTDLHPSALYDSCYDNLGFVFQQFLKRSLCGKGVLINKLIKSAKYIERIYDAVYRINSKKDSGKKNPVSPKFAELNRVAAELNRMRKALVAVDDMRPVVGKMLEVIIGKDDALKLQEKKNDDSAVTNVLIALTLLILAELKKDRVLLQKTTQNTTGNNVTQSTKS
jgi:hypothetical protein